MNTCAPNIIALTYVKETLLNHTLIVGDFYTLLSAMDRSTIQKLKREIREQTCHDSNGHNRHLQNTPPKHKRIYVLLSTSWDLL